MTSYSYKMYSLIFIILSLSFNGILKMDVKIIRTVFFKLITVSVMQAVFQKSDFHRCFCKLALQKKSFQMMYPSWLCKPSWYYLPLSYLFILFLTHTSSNVSGELGRINFERPVHHMVCLLLFQTEWLWFFLPFLPPFVK